MLKQTFKWLGILILVAAVVLLTIFFTRGGLAKKVSFAPASQLGAVSLSQGNYTNAKYKFSVNLPEGFTAREIPADPANNAGDTIIFENKKSDGIQITVSPSSDTQILTADMIKKAIPDMKISDVQTLEVGLNHKGVAFVSDNPEFGGSSREVWFVFKSNLYQISTYTRLDSLLQSIFATWQFQQ